MNIPVSISSASAASPLDTNAEILLSFCVPTYNRARFLDYLLKHFEEEYRFGFRFEIVISDNASTDDTADVVKRHLAAGLPIRFYQQESNKGSVANIQTTFNRARGKYILYLADDDLLLPDGVAEAMSYLREHPDVRALYAPWQLYDDIRKLSTANFFDIDKDEIFHTGQEIDLLELIVKKHIFPEIFIYRADAVKNTLMDARFCFYPFSHLAHLIAQGPVAFLKKPFYRSVTLSSVVPHRGQAGLDQAMTDWDNYRGGLEYFVYALLHRSGRTLPSEAKLQLREAIDGFVAARMRVAMRLWLGRRDFLRVYELACRLHYLEPKGIASVPRIDELPLLLAVQTLSRLANGIAELERIILVGASDPPSLDRLLREVGLEPRLKVVAWSFTSSDEDRHNSLVFLVQETDRATFLQLGYEPGLIISEAELMSGVHLG